MKNILILKAMCLVLAACSARTRSPLAPVEQTLGEYAKQPTAERRVEISEPFAFATPDGGLRAFFPFTINDPDMVSHYVAVERCHAAGKVMFLDGAPTPLVLPDGQAFLCESEGITSASKGGWLDVVAPAGATMIALPLAAHLYSQGLPENVGDNLSITNQADGGDGGSATATGGSATATGGSATATGGSATQFQNQKQWAGNGQKKKKKKSSPL